MFEGDLLDGGAVECFGFHKYAGVGTLDGGEKEAFCLDGRARHDYTKARNVCKEGFGGLRMVSVCNSH